MGWRSRQRKNEDLVVKRCRDCKGHGRDKTGQHRCQSCNGSGKSVTLVHRRR